MRSGPGEARTILLLNIISVRPSKQPLMVRTFLKVYMELGSSFLFLQDCDAVGGAFYYLGSECDHLPEAGKIYIGIHSSAHD